MSIEEDALSGLCPEKIGYHCKILYSRKFKPYNASIHLKNRIIMFSLSEKWETVSREIQIGLLQILLAKLFRIKKQTTNIDLYHHFLKNIHIAIPKTKTAPILEESFHRINERYFSGLMEKPNLQWGSHSLRKLGSYEYGSDTLTISAILQKTDKGLLDYIMHHELLHKKYKFTARHGRMHYHTAHFREKEQEFENSDLYEAGIRKLVKSKNYAKA